MASHRVSLPRTIGARFFLLFLLASLCGDMCVYAAVEHEKDDWGCGYALDGIDDYASFSMGSRDTDRMRNQGFTMMFWHRNRRKDKDGHFEQCLMSHSNDDYARYVVFHMIHLDKLIILE